MKSRGKRISQVTVIDSLNRVDLQGRASPPSKFGNNYEATNFVAFLLCVFHSVSSTKQLQNLFNNDSIKRH